MQNTESILFIWLYMQVPFFFIREVYVMKLFDDATSFCNEGAYTVIVVCVAT